MVSRDTSDPRQVQSEEEMQELRAHVEQDMLRKVLNTYEGRHVLFNVLAKAGIYHDILACDPEKDKLLGRRSMGLEILSELLTVDANIYTMMQQENASLEDKYTIHYDEEGKDREDEDD